MEDSGGFGGGEVMGGGIGDGEKLVVVRLLKEVKEELGNEGGALELAGGMGCRWRCAGGEGKS